MSVDSSDAAHGALVLSHIGHIVTREESDDPHSSPKVSCARPPACPISWVAIPFTLSDVQVKLVGESQLATLLVTVAVSRRLLALSSAARRSVAADASVFDRDASEKEAQLPVALERLRRSTQVRWTPLRLSFALPALVAVAVGIPAGFDEAAQWAFIAGALHLLAFGLWLAWLELFSHSVSELRRQQSLLGLSAGGGYFIGVAIDSGLVALSLAL